MPLSFVAHRQQQCRVRHVTNFIGRNLDEDITLDDLANHVHLSPAHLVRFYSERVGEAPMQTLRRLRLKRAFESLGQTGFGRITDVAMTAGYGSSAAFTHAFRKQFGIAPIEVPSLFTPPPPPEPIRLEYLPERKVWQFSYEGVYGQNGYYKARMAWLSYLVRPPGLLHWRLNDRDHPFCEHSSRHVRVEHFMPAHEAGLPFQESDLVTHPAGLYAVIEVSPDGREDLLAQLAPRIREELGCIITDARSMDHDIHERAHRAPQERRIMLYIPVAPVTQQGRMRERAARASCKF